MPCVAGLALRGDEESLYDSAARPLHFCKMDIALLQYAQPSFPAAKRMNRSGDATDA
jgi:hypothetical protein